MKNLLLLLSVVALISCGSKNNNAVDSGTVTTGTNGLDTGVVSNLVNFEGEYYTINQGNPDCGAIVAIERACNGYRFHSNVSSNAEDFCNVNKGEMRITRDEGRNPPNPDRNPPNPDSAVVVTQQANLLRATVRIANRSFTNTMTLDNNGILTKVTDLKGRSSRCVFKKR
jgi:hypothetical protein